MARGKPAPEQLDLSEKLQESLSGKDSVLDGTDCRNYGVLKGLPQMISLFAELYELPADQIYVGGVSSLNLMFDTFARHMIFGAYKGATPWAAQGEIKILCPCPGYDRHFSISQCFGATLVPVTMTKNGPDMDQVEELVKDPSVKGIWCVPKYSNPTGITFSDETVRRFAALTPAADDFRIFWDDAYELHDLYDDSDKLLNLYTELEKTGKTDMAYIFASFSKVTYAGASVSMMASGKQNMDYAMGIISMQTIGNDKMNQLRHLRFFENAEAVKAHMKKQAELLRPKFEAVLEVFERELAPVGVGSWTSPRGGYFISLDLPEGTATKTYHRAKALGVVLTPVGATFPYGKDPRDSNLRIAPSFPTVEDLKTAAEILAVCAKITYLEKLFEEQK
jgi:DNA-binding transcriptional MocR family regulator